MKASRIFLSAASLLALASPAWAQMYPGQGIAVNQAAVPPSGQTVVYRGSTYVRLPPLLQPGQPYPGEPAVPIQLHMPTEHPHHVARRQKAPDEDVATAPAPVATPEPTVAPAPAAAPIRPVATAPLPPPRPVSHVVRQESPPPAADTAAVSADTNSSGDAATAVPFSFGGPAVGPQQGPARQPALQPLPPHAETAHPAVAAAPRETPRPARAVATAAPVQTQHPSQAVAAEETMDTETVTHAPMSPSEEPPNLSKQSEIAFPHNATDPTPAALSELKQLASTLNSALNAGARRVQLDAFGGAPGDKSSDARRVSLKRALVIRQLLINDGVPASRIDVRAMGGIDDNGNADRVDVYVRAG